MSAANPTTAILRAAWRIAAAGALLGLSIHAPLAQQPRNRIGVPHTVVPAAPFVGRVAVRAPAVQSGGGSMGLRGAVMAPVHVPAAQPVVSSRNTIGGASFRPAGAALLPLGGPAKPGATGINGTTIRPKH